MRSTLILFFALLTLSLTAMGSDRQLRGTGDDTEVTRRIRESLVKEEGLSMKAQNISIVTIGNDVTLSGTLKKQKELARVLELTRAAAPGKNITHELKVDR